MAEPIPRVTGIKRIIIDIDGSAPQNIGGLLLATLREHGVTVTRAEVQAPEGERVVRH
jgi:hypothetical protein